MNEHMGELISCLQGLTLSVLSSAAYQLMHSVAALNMLRVRFESHMLSTESGMIELVKQLPV